jgi:hypothetical protein
MNKDWSAGERSDRADKAVSTATSNIHINPANKGKFTAFANSKGKSVQGAAHAVMGNKSASPKLRKEANFAIQSSRWSKK